MKIFYVDDDQEDRQFFCDVINGMLPDAVCEMATNGEEAMRKLKASKNLPQFIFLDLSMPIMDGMSCLREIKSNSKFKAIPIIIFSSSLSAEFNRDLKNLGAAQVILKPSTYADWGKALSGVFKKDIHGEI
jgi:CheY-like chemotaxis protein